MVSVWGMTDKGIVRRENQDSCAYDIIEEGKLAWGVVCDGMGGAKAGDVASKMAVEAFCTQMDQLGDLEGPPPAEALLRTATEDANRVVYLKAQTDADCIGMGTTLVGLILQEATLWVVNVGDSRAYRITKGGIRRITRDHSVVEDLVARGDLTPEQARSHPQKNLITRALGTSSRVKADLFQETVCHPPVFRRPGQPGDGPGDLPGDPGRRNGPRNMPAVGDPHLGQRCAGQRHRGPLPAVRRSVLP